MRLSMRANQPSRPWSLDLLIGVVAAVAIVVIVVFMRPSSPPDEAALPPRPLQPVARRPLKLSERMHQRPIRQRPKPQHATRLTQPEESHDRIVAKAAPVVPRTVAPRMPEPPAQGRQTQSDTRDRGEAQAGTDEGDDEPEPPDLEDDPDNVPMLSGVAVGDADPERRLTAVELLAATEDPQVITVLARALADENEEVRMAALEALSDFTGEAPAVAIEGALHDPSPDIRYEAVSMLADVGTERARRAVESALNDPDEEVRFLAQSVLDMDNEDDQAPLPPR